MFVYTVFCFTFTPIFSHSRNICFTCTTLLDLHNCWVFIPHYHVMRSCNRIAALIPFFFWDTAQQVVLAFTKRYHCTAFGKALLFGFISWEKDLERLLGKVFGEKHCTKLCTAVNTYNNLSSRLGHNQKNNCRESSLKKTRSHLMGYCKNVWSFEFRYNKYHEFNFF